MPLKQPFLKPLSKRQLRQQLQADTRVFLAQGGEVKEVPCGAAIYSVNDKAGNSHSSGFAQNPVPVLNKPDTRTWLPDLVAAIEQRKSSGKTSTHKPSPQPSRQKQWIYDDFGEPLRWVWKDN